LKPSSDKKVVKIRENQPKYEVRGPRGDIKITPDGVFLGPDLLSTLTKEIPSCIVEDNRSEILMHKILKMAQKNPSKMLQGIVESKD
tara:strand:+ start:103 stop:363 length:261 start_codon:yes stop_codon:yes gene_type:complete